MPKLKVSARAVAALSAALANSSWEGRSAMRNHRRLGEATRALLKENTYVDGLLDVDDDRLEYLKEIVEKAVRGKELKLAGVYAEGISELDDLLMAIEAAKDAVVAQKQKLVERR